MNDKKKKKRWERTNVTNLWKLATSGSYYARVKVNGKEKWRSLKTKVFGVAKLRLADFEREERAKSKRSADAGTQIEGGKCGKLLEIYLADMRLATDTKASSKYRTETAAKALLKTWPDFLTPMFATSPRSAANNGRVTRKLKALISSPRWPNQKSCAKACLRQPSTKP